MNRAIIGLAALSAMTPTLAMANPTFRPGQFVGSVVVLFTAFVMELAVTTGYLLCVGMAAGTVFVALLIVNMASYLGVLVPGLELGIPPIFIEVVIVCLEAGAIKVMSGFQCFQGDFFGVLKWKHAFIAAALGNALSYGVGLMIS